MNEKLPEPLWGRVASLYVEAIQPLRKQYQEGHDMAGNNNPGNFANDREKASEAGRKGGQNSGGNFANDREKASEAGRKGGQNSHGGRN